MPVNNRRPSPASNFINRSVAFLAMARKAKADADRRWQDCLGNRFPDNGQTVIADEGYIRESIENPEAKARLRVWSDHADFSGAGNAGAVNSDHGVY